MLEAIKVALKLIFHRPKMVLHFDYDKYWGDKRPNGLGNLTEFQKKRVNWISSQLEEGSSVLDVGCGDGAVLNHLSKLNSFNLTGMDLSESVVSFLNSNGIKAYICDLENRQDVDQIEECDYIILCEVLEHLRNPEELLIQLSRKARKGIFFSIPNSGYFPYRIRLLTGKSFMQWRLHPGEHLRFWTVSDLIWWLKELKLDKQAKLFFYEGIPGLNRVWPSLFSMGIVAKVDTTQ